MVGADVFTTLAQLAARICEARAAAIVPRRGAPLCWASPPFELAHLPLCLELVGVVREDEVYIIGDVRADGRFDAQLALGPPPVQFLAVLPLLGDGGRAIGRLVVADDRPRDVGAEHRLALSLVAQVASAELRRADEGGVPGVPPWLLDLLDNAPVGLHALDGTGTVRWMNQTELRWLGYAREEVVGKKHIGELVPADRRAAVRRNLTEVMTTGRTVVSDATLERRDGRAFPVHVVMNDVRDTTGALVRMRVAVLDRSELRLRTLTDPVFGPSEDARQLAQLRRCLAAGRAAAWHTDLLTGRLYAEGSLASLLGVDEAPGPTAARMQTILHPDDLHDVEAALDRARRDRTEYRHTHRMRAPDGTYHLVAVSGGFRYDADGTPISLNGVVVAVDPPGLPVDRADSKRSMADILESISDGFVALDRDWNYTYVNRHAGQMFGRAPAELVGRHIWTEFPEGKGQPFHLAYERARREQIAIHFEEYYPPWDRWYENRVYPTPDDGLLIFFTDVSDRHVRDEERRKAADRLRQLSERLMTMREEEAARLAREVHDGLGQTLAALKLDLTWIGHQVDGDATELAGVRAKLGEATKLVDELFAAIRRMSSELRPRMLEDLGLAATIDWYARGLAARSGLDCALALDTGDLPIPRATATALYRVLQECLTNVVRHAKARTITVRLERSGDDVVMTVQDDGRGVTASQVAQSPGLGLLGVQERMNLVGGSFVIGGAPGGGTIATARAPLTPRGP